MTKSDLVKKLKEKHGGLYLKDVAIIVDTVLDEISKSLSNKERVELRGFGTFSTRRRNARKARNPKTGEIVMLNERHTTYFRPGKELRERVNRETY